MYQIKPNSIIFFLSSFLVISGQELPEDFFDSKIVRLNFDLGQNWKSNTTFGPARYQSLDNYIDHFEDSLSVKILSGIFTRNKSLAIFLNEHITFKKYFYAFLYARMTNDSKKFPRFSGEPQKKSRIGLNSGEVDVSGFGYQNDWLLFQIGRGRQSWGAGNSIQISLSENSNSYDYALFGLDFGKLRYKYFHGFLESDTLGHNRYIVSKGLEYSNLKSLIFSLSEIIIYSGLNRPFDFAYLNPISSHLEIEFNNRQNSIGTKSGNAIWQLSLDWMINQNLRFSGNLVIDEIVLDESEKVLGKNHRTANSLKISNNIYSEGKINIISYFSFIQVGSLAFRHGDGNNNFINRNKPLGWKHGSDGYEKKIGVNCLNKHKYIISLEFGVRYSGENNIIYYPYETYSEYQFSNFPSGDVSKISFINSSLIWKVKSYLNIVSSIEYKKNSPNFKDYNIILGLDLGLPIKIL
jgi:hypothetical protein